MENALDILKERGFVEQVSDEEGLRRALTEPTSFYIGYDPSASSLHAGSLLTVMALAHLQRHGHRPIIIVGGGTGMIGDPSGRTEMRQMMTQEQIIANIEAIKRQLSRFISFEDDRARIVNNGDWLLPLRYIDFLREIGVHFSVNRMLAAEAYRTRLEQGLSFIEFNYQLLQSYDFLHLFRTESCLLQVGGNDQWGNILAGVDLIRRVTGQEAYALCFPLLTTASGAKMGKTGQGTVWLDRELLSPYDFYQFWIDVADADVERFLKIYTFLPMEQIAELARLEGATLNEAKEILAYEVTAIAHGKDEADLARDASRQVFGGAGAGEAVPITMMARAELEQGIPVIDLFCRAGLTASRGAARRLVEQGGAYVNDEQVQSVEQIAGLADLHEGSILLRYGKKRYHRIGVA
jgi:tyrosyl-tRNA synthetase